MAINFENKYETERRINTPATEKTVDKLYGAMYNDGNSSTKSDVGNYVKKQPTQPDTTKRFGFAPEINSWAKKNQDAIKYAGDGAINSIKKASNDYLNEYLKDAPEETDKDELFGSIAKWQLARDANDEKRGNVARNNIIGHMSTENKDHYLKEQIPFSEYVKAKDDFDYKTGKYTTTEYASKIIDEAVKRLQQKLNENGYTDNYGNKLNEDGTVGSKTLQAYDSYENDPKNEVEAQHTGNDFEVDTTKIKKLVPDEHQNEDVLVLNKGMKLASAGGPIPTKDMATVVNAPQTAETENIRFDKEGLERYHNSSLPVRTGNREQYRKSNNDNVNVDNMSNGLTYVNANGITKWKEIPYTAQRLPVETQLYRDKKISTKVYETFDLLSQEWYNSDTQERRDEISKFSNSIRDNNYSEDLCVRVLERLKDIDEFDINSNTYKILNNIDEWYCKANNEEKKNLQEISDKARRLEREGTPLLYAQEKIIDELHSAVKYAESVFETYWAYPDRLSVLTKRFYTPQAVLGKVDSSMDGWNYKWRDGWRVPYDIYNWNEDGKDADMNKYGLAGILGLEGSYPKNWMPWMYFDGMVLSAADMGNLALGYVMSSMGFGPEDYHPWNDEEDGNDRFWQDYGERMAKEGR